MDQEADELLLEMTEINEKTIVSYHKRPVDVMANKQKECMAKNDHKIIHHKTFKDGSHEIVHKTPSDKLRMTTIVQAQKRGAISKITNKPAPEHVKTKYDTNL